MAFLIRAIQDTECIDKEKGVDVATFCGFYLHHVFQDLTAFMKGDD